MLSELEWAGVEVRHSDGRCGFIEVEHIGCMYTELTIKCDDGSIAMVRLNTNGKDTGEIGWEWFCEGNELGDEWLPLGDARESERIDLLLKSIVDAPAYHVSSMPGSNDGFGIVITDISLVGKRVKLAVVDPCKATYEMLGRVH